MPTVKALEDQIFQKEGFKVKLTPFDAKLKDVDPYGYDYMASNKWRLSDWKRERLTGYLQTFKAIEVFRGDGSHVKSDIRLGNLRDSYFDAHYGEDDAARVSNVVALPVRRRGAAAAGRPARQ